MNWGWIAAMQRSSTWEKKMSMCTFYTCAHIYVYIFIYKYINSTCGLCLCMHIHIYTHIYVQSSQSIPKQIHTRCADFELYKNKIIIEREMIWFLRTLVALPGILLFGGHMFCIFYFG